MVDSSDTNQRKHSRLSLQSKVKVSHETLGQFESLTDNLSDGGLLIKTGQLKGIKTGEVMTVQSIDVAADAPILPVKVVRVTATEIAVEFIHIQDHD